ncbi:MAG TPA: TolC family protein [Kofleriaceae bacterium]|nr:TolC family protein [Kofleriaceae bacterium]
MRVPVVVAIAVSAVSSLARADDTLTLPQVLAAAVRQSPDLERASIDLKTAEAALLRAKGIEDTHLGATGQIDRFSITADDVTAVTTEGNGSVSLTKTLPTGTVVGVSLGTFYNSQPEASVTPVNGAFLTTSNYLTAGTFTLTQPLLRGAWSGFDAPIRDAEHGRDAAKLAREAKARDLIVQIAEAYWQVSLARESLDVRKASLDLAKQQLATTEAQIRIDKVARSEALAVKQVIATRQQDVISAEQQIYDRSLALRELAGLEIGPDALAVKTETLGAIGDDTLDLKSTVAAAFEHSAQLASLAEGVKAAEANIDTAQSAARPRLDVSVGGGPAGTDTSFAKSIQSVVRSDGYELTANVTFDATIERHAEKGGLADAHARLQRTRVDERAARAHIATQAIRIVQRVKAAYASAKLSDEAIQLANQNIDAEKKRFELGKSTNFDVLRRQDELEQANLRKVSAIVDYLSARAELDALTGAILSKYAITLR